LRLALVLCTESAETRLSFFRLTEQARSRSGIAGLGL
jgi:hypothetical protein